jgi:SAM-dependent methyltransferase
MATALSVSNRSLRPTPQPEWFASWFDSAHYHRLYANRDGAEAARFLDQLLERGHLTRAARVLDLGCGSGRHAHYLASKGFDVTGLDLSAESLDRARADAPSNARFIRQDMRLPFRTCPFNHVLNLFTSFGYFADPADNVSVIHNVASSLKEEGTLILDYLNVHQAVNSLRPDETVERGEVAYRITRWADADDIFKRIVVEDPALERPLVFVERVARLTVDDFRFMFAVCGLAIETVYGDYSLGAFDEADSRRLILIARKAAPRAESALPAGKIAAYAADRFRRHAQV